MGGSMSRFRRSPLRLSTAAVLLAATGALMALLVFLGWQAPPQTQDALLFLVPIPMSAAMGALSGLLLRRPRAGAWAFSAAVGGALVGNLAAAALESSHAYWWGPNDWAAIELSSLLNSLFIGVPAGALGYTVGAAGFRGARSRGSAGWAAGLGFVPLLVGLVMMPVAVVDWAAGYPGSMAVVGILAGGGLTLILGALWSLWAPTPAGPPNGPREARGPPGPPPQVR